MAKSKKTVQEAEPPRKMITKSMSDPRVTRLLRRGGLVSDLISYLQETVKNHPNALVVAEIANDYGDINVDITMTYSTPESDEQLKSRLVQEAFHAQESLARERAQYETLRKKFET